MTLVIRLYRGGESVFIFSKGQKPIKIGLDSASQNPRKAGIYINSDEDSTIILRESIVRRDYSNLYEKIKEGMPLTDEEFLSMRICTNK